jgi:hypothetical protein
LRLPVQIPEEELPTYFKEWDLINVRHSIPGGSTLLIVTDRERDYRYYYSNEQYPSSEVAFCWTCMGYFTPDSHWHDVDLCQHDGYVDEDA